MSWGCESCKINSHYISEDCSDEGDFGNLHILLSFPSVSHLESNIAAQKEAIRLLVTVLNF